MKSSRFGPGSRALPPAVGDVAPDFTLRWTFDRSVSLSEMLSSGPVLLVFYVFDFGHY